MFAFLQRLFGGRGGDRAGITRMLRLFDTHQQQLQDEFFRMASSQGKPRGLRWKKCEWLEARIVTNDPESSMLTLFQSINLSFEAIEGGDMEEVEAVSMIRDATAVFHGKDGRWGTGGKVLFNMDPETAATTVAAQQERVG